MAYVAILAGLLALATGATSAAEDLVEQGRRIYQSGVLPDGNPLTAVGAGGSETRGALAACETCHRRSGMGSREGSLRVTPISGPVLYSRPVSSRPTRPGRSRQEIEPLRQDARAAYDDATLVRAIRGGIDSRGRPLTELMPRYPLDDAAASALVAYLRQLSAAAAPGVEPNMLHLATIVTPDASELARKSVLEAMSAWSKGGALGGVPIALQLWRLSGAKETWTEQLERLYRQQPVFAVLSGAGGAHWSPVRDFCERTALPCLFPIVDVAPTDASDFYTLYFTTGVPLEARLLAKHASELSPRPQRVIQIVSDEAGAAAARELAAGLPGVPVETRSWRADQAATLLGDVRTGDMVVGWLRPAEMKALAEAYPQGLQSERIIFSGQLAPPEKTDLPGAWRVHARWISVRSDPARRHGNAVIGLVPWAAHLHLPLTEEALLADVYAATYYFGDALARMRGHWTAEYLMETLETAEYSRPVGAAYVTLSLAAGQREAAKGGRLLGFAAPDYQRIVPLSPRLAP